jgi:hypothetical protein
MRALCVQYGSFAGDKTRIACREKELIFRNEQLL